MSQANFNTRNLAVIFAFLTSADVVASNLVISQDTTWHAGEVHDLHYSTVQIARGATLTIEGGVDVINGDIWAYGALNAVGTPDALVRFKNVGISYRNQEFNSKNLNEGRINIAYAYIEEGAIDTSRGYGSITLTDSIVIKLNKDDRKDSCEVRREVV